MTAFLKKYHNFLFSWRKGWISLSVGIISSGLTSKLYYMNYPVIDMSWVYINIIPAILSGYIFWTGWYHICCDAWRKKEYRNRI